jgi:hypothetical protein
MQPSKPNKAQKLVFNTTKKILREALKKYDIKGVKIVIALEQGAPVLRLYGVPDDVRLAKFAIDTHMRPKTL